MAKSKPKAKSTKSAESACKPLSAANTRAKKRVLHQPVEQVTVGRNTKVADLVDAMSGMSIQARNIGMCAKVMSGMYEDKGRPTVFLGLAGPLIAAGLRNVIRDLIVGGYVDIVVSTGAILYQDIYQARGYQHYRGTPAADDVRLRELMIDRIYDTYVDEEKFWETDVWCGRVADELPRGPTPAGGIWITSARSSRTQARSSTSATSSACRSFARRSTTRPSPSA